MGKSNSVVINRFFCINCGNESTPLARKRGHQHERFHRKKCFCVTCQRCINHVECKNETDIEDFKAAFIAGEYAAEAAESVALAEPMTGFLKG